MRGKRVLGENSGQTCFSKKTNRVNNGKVKVTPEKIVVIDLDEDNVVIIDDAPESSDKNFKTSTTPRDHGKFPSEGVIHIDDDDDDDGDGEDRGVGVGIGVEVEVDGDMVSDGSSSKSNTHFPSFRTTGSTARRHMDESEFVTIKTTAFQFSKCKQTYCTKSPSKNRFGLDPSCDRYSTDSDSSDCEIVVDSYGTVREQWERASLRKKHVQNRHSGMEDQSSASESKNKDQANFAEENNKEQHCRSGNSDFMKENQAGSSDSVSMDAKKSEEKSGSVQEKESFGRNEDFQPGGASVSGHPHDKDVQQNEEDELDDQSGRKNKEPNVRGSPCRSFEQEFGDKQATPPGTSAMEKDNLDSAKGFVRSFRLFGKTHVNGSDCPDENLGGKSEDISSRGVSAECKWESSYGKGFYQGDRQKESEGASVHNSSCHRPNFDLNESCFGLENEQDGDIESNQDATPPFETCIITDREKIKDTEEFKRAIEEEWASRQRELEIQSEEARKLRKRKKAETMRLCDIERRQKQRVEEVRETQKKNAEDINFKEKLRGEIRKEISRLEITCIDMASLLRGLGIPVNGGYKPMSQDVNAAYKRALLKFHPDRASRMDIRQQVEAEEKFKLISRMKEKFCTSCC